MKDEIKDIINCIISFDDSETLENKGEYFEVIQRDLRIALEQEQEPPKHPTSWRDFTMTDKAEQESNKQLGKSIEEILEAIFKNTERIHGKSEYLDWIKIASIRSAKKLHEYASRSNVTDVMIEQQNEIRNAEDLRKKFKDETGTRPDNSQGEPDIEYVWWLENRLCEFISQQKAEITDEMVEKWADEDTPQSIELIKAQGIIAAKIIGAKAYRDNLIK